MKYSVVVSGAFHRVEIKISKCSEKLTFPTKKKLVYSFVVFFCSGGNVEVKKNKLLSNRKLFITCFFWVGFDSLKRVPFSDEQLALLHKSRANALKKILKPQKIGCGMDT